MATTKDHGKTDKATTDGVITAVYKVNLHCRECASQIKKPLLRTQGVHSVDVDIEKGETKVKGVIDVIKIQKLIAKLSKKKVDLISPQPPVVNKEKPDKVMKETQEQSSHTTSMKVHLHCEKCEKDLQNKLLKNKGIHSVKTDRKAQTVTVQGTIKSDKLLSYIRKNVHKHAEIISSKKVEEEKKKDIKADDAKSSDKIAHQQLMEFKHQVKVEAKSKDDNVPYFIHYVYAPQLFSDENPNACCIM